MPVRSSVYFQTLAATKLIAASLNIKNPNEFPTRDVWRDSIPKCPPSDSTSLLQYENEPQRKIRRTLNVSAYHDKILSDEWDIDFLKTTMNIKPKAMNKGFSLDEIKATNFELLETSLVVVLDTTDDYVIILGGQRGTIVKCLYTNSAGVRKAFILALQDVYDVDDNVPFHGPFTLRFYKRMLDVADDNDISVAFSSSQPCSSGDEGDEARIHLRRMRQILREFSTDQVLSLYLIDDIWEFMDAMQRITSMLLYENPSVDLTNDDATNLTLLFCASVKKAIGEIIVLAIDHQKPNHTKAHKETARYYVFILLEMENFKHVSVLKSRPDGFCGGERDGGEFVAIGETGVFLLGEGDGGNGGRLCLRLQGSRIALWHFLE
ncbi:sister-chromatid cohesion protein 3 [Tanacetum coccineum]